MSRRESEQTNATIKDPLKLAHMGAPLVGALPFANGLEGDRRAGWSAKRVIVCRGKAQFLRG